MLEVYECFMLFISVRLLVCLSVGFILVFCFCVKLYQVFLSILIVWKVWRILYGNNIRKRLCDECASVLHGINLCETIVCLSMGFILVFLKCEIRQSLFAILTVWEIGIFCVEIIIGA